MRSISRVKFISFDKKDRSILVRNKKLRCIIGLDENYVYCYKTKNGTKGGNGIT